MEGTRERRSEMRLRYQWPVWFAENFNETLSQGQLIDVCSGGIGFTCSADENCPFPGQYITARFSVPRFGSDDSFDLASFTRQGRTCRVDVINDFIRRVAVQFAEPLPFMPGEQTEDEIEAGNKLRAVTI